MLPVEYPNPAEHYFGKLRDAKLKEKFLAAILDIRQNPEIGTRKLGDLAGIYGYAIHHQGTNYEIAYRLSVTPDGQMVVVIMAGTRENFYRALKKYMA